MKYNGSGGNIPVVAQPILSSQIIGGWASPLSTAYPYRTGLATLANNQPSAQVLSSGQNQAGDPRANFSGLWDIAMLQNNAQLGGGPVIGGSNINIGSSGLSVPMLFILAGAVLLFIWK